MSRHVMTQAAYFDLARTLSAGHISRHQGCAGYPDPVAARAELKRRFHAHSTPESRGGRTFEREGTAVVITTPHDIVKVTVIDFEEPSLFNQGD